MNRIYSKAKNLISYFKLASKSGKDNRTNPLENIFSFHKEFKKLGLGADFKTNKAPGTSTEAQFGEKKYVMFASNNYLDLSTRPEVIERAAIQLRKHGLGPGGSRFLCGNVDVLEDLDKKTAELVGTEDAITFPTGFMANLAVFQAIMDPLVGNLPFAKGAGVIFSDEYNHGSIIDGCRLSSAKKITFRHNDLQDLIRKLIEYKDRQPKMIVTEGVFTPHGDMAPLKEIVKIAKEFNAILVLDDAHGVGVFGNKGGGTTEHHNLQGQVDIVMGSYDKALGGMGGFLAGKKELIEYLRISSRPYIFSSSISAVLAGGLIESINQCQIDNESRKKLFKNANYVREGLRLMGYKILGSEDVPVVLVYIGEENKSIEFSNMIFNSGIYCPSFRWPAVPQGSSRVRVTLMSNHSQEQLDALLEVFRKVGTKINLI